MNHIKPIVLITGASGNLGRSVAKALMDQYQIVGLDWEAKEIAPGIVADSDDIPALSVDPGDDAAGGGCVAGVPCCLWFAYRQCRTSGRLF